MWVITYDLRKRTSFRSVVGAENLDEEFSNCFWLFSVRAKGWRCIGIHFRVPIGSIQIYNNISLSIWATRIYCLDDRISIKHRDLTCLQTVAVRIESSTDDYEQRTSATQEVF